MTYAGGVAPAPVARVRRVEWPRLLSLALDRPAAAPWRPDPGPAPAFDAARLTLAERNDLLRLPALLQGERGGAPER